MTTHAYHQTKKHKISNTITALLTIVLVLNHVMLPYRVLGARAEAPEVVPPAEVTENRLLSSARALELPPSNYTYAPPAQQEEPFDEPKSILSPAAYLIYLLDFVSRSVEPTPGNGAPALDSLAGFETLFKQDFSALLASEANNDPVSYVECTNMILENLIVQLDPDLSSTSSTIDLAEEQLRIRNRCGIATDPDRLDDIYAQFQNLPNNDDEERSVEPEILVNLFDAYVRELDTTRAQVGFVMNGTTALQDSLAADLHMPLEDGKPDREALQKINLPDEKINYGSIVVLKDLLWDIKWAEAEAVIRSEQRSEIQDAMYREFRSDYRTIREENISAVLQELIATIDSEDPAFDEKLNEKRTEARTCVMQGEAEACPENSAFANNPLRMLRELLKHESLYIDPHLDGYMFRLQDPLDTNLDVDEQKQLIATEFVTQGISILTPTVSITTTVDNEWHISANTEDSFISVRVKTADDQTQKVFLQCSGLASIPAQTLAPEEQEAVEAEQKTEEALCLRRNELTTQRFQELSEEFPGDPIGLRKEAEAYAEERLWSEDEFERQLEKLAQVKYDREFGEGLSAELLKDVEVLARQTWQEAVDQAEAGYQTKLRANLLALLQRKEVDFPILAGDSFAEALADNLLLDLFMDESQVTTPLAFAIGRLHTLVQGARLGNDKRYRPHNFDESAWSILSSYGIFHAAMTVSNYPESFLFPELRPNKTNLFASAMVSVTQGININQVHEQYAEQFDQLRGLELNGVVPAGDKVFIFASNDDSGATRNYYSVLKHDGQWKEWQPLPEATPLGYTFAFTPETILYHQGYVVFFGLGIRSGNCKIAYSRLQVDGDQLLAVATDDPFGLESNVVMECSCDDHSSIEFASFAKGGGYGNEVFAYAACQANGKISSIFEQTFVFFPEEEMPHDETRPSHEDDINIEEFHPVSNSKYHLWHFGDEEIAIYLWPVAELPEERYRSQEFYSLPKGVTDVVATSYEQNQIDVLYREAGVYKHEHITRGDSRSRWSRNSVEPVNIRDTHLFDAKAVARINDTLFGFFVSEEEDSKGLYYANLSEPEPTPIRISLPIKSNSGKGEIQSAAIQKPVSELFMHRSDDLATLNDHPYGKSWLEDYYLHFPIMVANYLMENQSYDEAFAWLSEIYNPSETDEGDREVYPRFHSAQEISDTDEGAPAGWLQDPFTPHSMADQDPSRYLLNTKLVHVENLLDWADALFTLDTVESVNRARELYELSGRTLNLTTQPADYQCHISYPRFGKKLVSASTVWADLANVIDDFCLPTNPMIKILRWRIEANLFKIHTNRNFAGLQRNMPFYATPLDPTDLVQAGGVGTSAFNQSATAGPPPVYRYSFLLDRARHLTEIAQQLENSMLSTIEKEEAETYTYMRAKQDLNLERAGVVLQDLRLKEANDSKRLATEQRSRAETQQAHYSGLLNDMSIAALELYSLALQAYAATLYTAAAFAGGPSQLAQGIQATSSALQMGASYEIRRKEWELQEALADHDITIATIGEDLADDRISIVNQERNIANQRVDFATDVVEYLNEKFNNRDLYRWMNQHLRQLYRDQLNLAISTAKAAEHVLEFERQTSLDFIDYDYWEDEKQGLLGAERLRQDLVRMEQFRLNTATRRKEIEKTLSLASVAPVEFQRFKETGVLEFATLPQWFDRDFPGHYLRLIKDVRVNLVAIVPSTDGIHATLSNNGISRVMTGAPFEERTVIYRQPESVAISSPNNATGLFELNPNDPMLFPFEASGVDTAWTFQMDKGTNRLNYDTIYDVLFTIRYTALEDNVYRKKVLEEMGQDEDGYVKTEFVRFFSLANEFVDEWYGFHNPLLGRDEYLDPYDDCDASDCETTFAKLGSEPLRPYTMVIDLTKADFPYNEEQIKMKSVTLVIQPATADQDTYSAVDQDTSPAINFQLKLVPDRGSKAETGFNFAEGETVESTMEINSKRPFGRWILQVEYQNAEDEDVSWLKDMLLIIEYEARVHYN